MTLKEDVIDRIDIPVYKEPLGEETEEDRKALEAKLQYNEDRLIAAVVTQDFHYMVENGLEHSHITTGEAFAFLHVEAHDPTTLHYHIAVPSEDANEQLGISSSQTAIGQVIGLCLIAFQSKQRDLKWRKKARKPLKKWNSGWLDILNRIPESERKRSPKGSVFRSRKPAGKRAYDLRPRPGDRGRRDPSNDREGGSGTVGRPARQNDASGDRRIGESDGDGDAQRGTDDRGCQDRSNQVDSARRPYCTQKCLLGITQGLPLDVICPNMALHPRTHGKRAIGWSQCLHLVRTQLAADLDHDCKPLGLQGARGALFKIALVSHGYVFVGKGTVEVFVPHLLHEGVIYQRLGRLQGTAVPVCLGNIDLVEKYYLDASNGVGRRHNWG